MKFLIFFWILVLALFSFDAKAFDVPQDAVIKVYDSKGKLIGNMSRKKYKVVKIEDHPKAQEPKAETMPKSESEEPKKNLIIVHVGTGKNGLDYSHGTGVHEVTEKQDVVGGLTYCREVKNGYGGCATGMTNETYTLGVSKGF